MTRTRRGDQRPNVLWFCTDQQRFDTVGAAGNPLIHTPNLDRLAASGVLFEHAYCQSPICTPSRGSFLTGRYPGTTKLRQNGQQILPNERPVANDYVDAGYSTGLAGKLHLSWCQGRAEHRVNDGYQEFAWSHSNMPKWEENQYARWLLDEKGNRWEDTYSMPYAEIAAAGPVGGMPAGRVVWAGQPPELHQTAWCTNKAIDFMERHRDQPWLFSINVFDPHHPFDPPEEYLRRYNPADMPLPAYRDGELADKPFFQTVDHGGAYGGKGLAYTELTDLEHQTIKAAYFAMIENIDANVGRLLDYLEETGQRENTIFVFMSDHGEMLGDHGIYCKGPYLYDAATRVPLIISQPGTVVSGLRSTALVELVDIAPTLLELSGLGVPDRMQGESLKEICLGHSDPGFHRQSAYSEYHNALCGVREPLPYLASIRDHDFRIVVYAGLDAGELYDLRSDEKEHRNRWYDPAYRDVKERYLCRCIARMMHTADPHPARMGDF